MNVRLLLITLAIACRAEIIDRIAVTVGSTVITESEILREARLTAFLNGEPLDFTASAKRKTAERLVEQRLIQLENEASLYPPPPAEALDELLKQVQGRFPDPAHYRDELRRAGVSEEDLKAHLRRQLTVLRFLDLRFRPGVHVGEEAISAYFDQHLAPELKKTNPSAELSLNDYRQQIEETLIGERIDKASDAWLKEARSRTRIEFRANAFSPDPARQEADPPVKADR
jgi:hypothetical protein